jgi:3-oxoacyl-[acyl-carrier-protein] synthase-3
MKTSFSNLKIDCVCSYLPTEKRNFKGDCVSLFGLDSVNHTIKHTGIEELRVADESETSLDMCFKAAEYLLNKENINKESIDGLVMISQTFDYVGPASSIILQDKLGLSKQVVCFDIVYGCSGYVYGLFQAASLIASGSCKKVLLVNGETNTRLMDDTIKDQYLVFGDAASATIISTGNTSMRFQIMSDGSRFSSVLNLVNGFRPPILLKNGVHPVNHLGQFAKATNDGLSVFDFILNDGANAIKEIVRDELWNMDEINFFGLHQATKVTLNFLRRRLKLDEFRAPFAASHFGNTSSVTIPLVLTKCANGGEYNTKNWRKVILAAFGLGLSWGVVTCDLSNTNFYGPLNDN